MSPVITKETVVQAAELSPRRICLTSTHANALKRDPTGRYVGSISFPFKETVKPIFEGMTGLSLFDSNFGGVWRSISSEGEFESVDAWRNVVGGMVFLRDTLTCSVALAEHMRSDGIRSDIGDLEYRAKYERDSVAISQLIDAAVTTIKMLPGYRDCFDLTAVPSRPGKDFDLPTLLAASCAQRLGFNDWTSSLMWQGSKASLKELPLVEKWDALEQVGLVFGVRRVPSRIILIDDLYQSGTTMQWVASRLVAAGVREVYGFSITKSRNNSDNLL